MKTRKLSFVLALLILASSFMWVMPGAAASVSYASDVYTEDIYDYRIWNGEAVIVGCDPSVSGKIVIPETLGGYSVTRISDSAFADCNGITDIVFHSGIKEIGVDVPVMEQVDIPLETYYSLYVSDGLLYHLNFASATADMVVAPKNASAELAASKFGAATDTYDDFYIYKKVGITTPWSGGTATIAEGGWKFTTPYIYSYWFNEDGSLAHTGGSTATFDNFVTETGLAGVPYYMSDGKYVVADSARTIGGVTKTTYTLVHTAPKNATGYYIAGGTWGGAFYSSAFGNGYFDAAKGNDIKIYNGGVKAALDAAEAYTVELTAASSKLKSAAFFIGPRLEFAPLATTVKFTGGAGYEMLASNSGFSTIEMPLEGAKINTYSFAFDLADIANYNYTLNAYGNGKNFSTQELVSKTNAFSTSAQYVMRDSGLYTYAMRVYEKELSANEVLRNHFADVALFARLNITEFLTLDDVEKQTVYNAFELHTPDEIRTELQILLEKTILALRSDVTDSPETTAPVQTAAPEIPESPVSPLKDYYDLYVQDALLLHLNFAEASEYTPDIVGGTNYLSTEVSAASRFDGASSNYTPFLVYSKSTNPVKGGTAKIIAPWFYKNWYVNGYYNDHESGNGVNLQYEEPLEYDELGERNGKNVYIRYTNEYTDEYYINDGTWANKTYASKWSKGSIMLGENNSLYFGSGIDVTTGSGYTMNFSVKSAVGAPFKAFMGPRYVITPSSNGVTLTGGGGLIVSGFNSVKLTDVASRGINNYSMQVDLSDLENNKATLGVAVNGVSYSLQTVKSASEVESLRQFFCDGDEIYLYAIRTYGKILSDVEIMQNNFADIATVNRLDISVFKLLDESDKAEVYAAFSGKTSDTDKAELQSILDDKIEELGYTVAPAVTTAVATESVATVAPVTTVAPSTTAAVTTAPVIIETPVFSGCTSLKTVTILSPNCKLNGAAFVLSDTVTVYGYAPSTAKEYADANGNAFVDFNEDEAHAYYAGAFSENAFVFRIERATGSMSVSGDGIMEDYSTESAPIWNEYRDVIRSLTVKEGVKNLGAYAFAGCYNLSNVRFSSTLNKIGESAFARTGIERVSIPAGITEIGKDAFYLCNIKRIDVNKSNPVYIAKGNCLIERATGELLIGTESSVIPADGSAVSIADSAFAGRKGLTEIFIPELITEIGSGVFDGCTALESITVNISNQFFMSIDNCLVETATQTLIYGCKNSIIPADDCVIRIGDGAFSSCVGLADIEIPDTITEIGDKAFAECSDLDYLEIPASVTKIGSEAFRAAGLKEVVMISSVPPALLDGAFDDCESLSSIFVPKGSVTAYKSAPVWSGLSSVIFEQCEHSFVNEVALDEYLKSEATCANKAIYYKSCECGKSSAGTVFEATFEYGELEDHVYDCEKPSMIYRKNAATLSNPAIYYKSCECGKKGTETFAYGDKLPSDSGVIVYVDRVNVLPNSLFTVNLNVKDNPGMAFLSVTLDYDESVMTLVDIENGTVFPTLDSGRNLVWSADGDCFEDGILATLTFELKENVDCADTAINITLNEVYNFDYEAFDLSASGGMVCVQEFAYGDANGDGMINSIDVILLRMYMANYNFGTGTSSVSVSRGADADGSGYISSTDVVLLRVYMANYDYTTGASSVELGPQ